MRAIIYSDDLVLALLCAVAGGLIAAADVVAHTYETRFALGMLMILFSIHVAMGAIKRA